MLPQASPISVSLKSPNLHSPINHPSLEPPNRGKTTKFAVKFLRRTHQSFRICKRAESGKLRVESNQIRTRTGSTCLLVTKVQVEPLTPIIFVNVQLPRLDDCNFRVLFARGRMRRAMRPLITAWLTLKFALVRLPPLATK